MPIYVITETGSNGDKPRQYLVSAANPAQAIKAISKPHYTAKIADNTELISLTKAGVEVIGAKAAE